MQREELLTVLTELYDSNSWPKPFNLLQGVALVREQGATVADAAGRVGTTRAVLDAALNARDAIAHILDATPTEVHERRSRQMLGNLIVGQRAEAIFVEMYKQEAHVHELALRDLREGRSDTDYRLYNGRNRPVYRLNIKFHGTLFRLAREWVGLEPEDCFPLATYKIHGALQKQVEDSLPYLFVIVSAPGLNADGVGGQVPERFLRFMSLVAASKKVPLKRNIEERIVAKLEADDHPAVTQAHSRIASARWYVLGATRAMKLLRENLFERVFALRTKNFAQQFRRAELDMHFSLSRDLTPLATYLQHLHEHGYPVVTTRLANGDI